jgi:hypothetical protein
LRRYLFWIGSNLSSCTVVVNAPQSYWPDVIQKKNDKKRSKYVALDFFCPFFIFYFLLCFFIFVNLREGEKNLKKQIQKNKIKKKQIRSLRFFCPFLFFIF